MAVKGLMLEGVLAASFKVPQLYIEKTAYNYCSFCIFSLSVVAPLVCLCVCVCVWEGGGGGGDLKWIWELQSPIK